MSLNIKYCNDRIDECLNSLKYQYKYELRRIDEINDVGYIVYASVQLIWDYNLLALAILRKQNERKL